MSAIDIIPVCMLHMRSLIIRLSFLYICVLLIVFCVLLLAWRIDMFIIMENSKT